MLFNFLLGIYCFQCRQYKNPYTEIYLPDGSENEGRVNCLDCDSLLGFTWDKCWSVFWREK